MKSLRFTANHRQAAGWLWTVLLLSLWLLTDGWHTSALAQSNFPTAVQITQLVADDGQEHDTLGFAVAVSGDLLLAGAPHNYIEGSNRSGAAYLFARNQGGADGWGQVAKLVPNDSTPYDQFGYAVTLSGDWVAVGAPSADVAGKSNQGAIYVFMRNPTNPNQWEQVQKLVIADGAAEDHFGITLALEGDYLLAGALGKAYLFAFSSGAPGNWTLRKVLQGSDAQPANLFGTALALHGDRALIGAPGASLNNTVQGAAYLFERNQGGADNWGEVKKFNAADGRIDDLFGHSVVLLPDRAIIGAPQLNFPGQVLIFARDQGGANQWGEVQRLSVAGNPFSRRFGLQLAFGGDHLAVRSLEENYVYTSDPAQPDAWTLVRRLISTGGGYAGFDGAGIAIRDRWAFVGMPETSVRTPTTTVSAQGVVHLFDYTMPPAPTISFSQTVYTVTEGIGEAQITLTLDVPNPYPAVSIRYQAFSRSFPDATAPDDFLAADGILTIPQNASQATFTVTIVNDALLERAESLSLELSEPTNALAGQSFARLTIEDDEPATCDFIASDEATLDRAIRCANVAGPGTHTISVTADISYSQSSTLLINPEAAQIVIEGNGHSLDAQGHGRGLTLYLTNLHIRNLTLTGGRLPMEGDNRENGGAILLRGSHGDGTCGLMLENSVIEDNEAGGGGAIINLCDLSTMTINNSILRNNRAFVGGAIYMPTGEELVTYLVMNNSIVSNNRAQTFGGGLYLDGGDAGSNTTINDSMISDNLAVDQDGGGIRVETGESAVTNVTINRSAITGNSAQNGGGLQVDSRGSTHVTLANVTVSGNRAISQTGGGVLVKGVNEFDFTDVRVINSSIASNTAPSGGGIYQLDGRLILSNTLVAENPTGGDCVITTSPGIPSNYRSGGHNLDGDGSCLPVGVRQASDIPNGLANLGPLAANGGPTLSHALLPGSQAIDAGDDATCAADPVNGVDQRWRVRPQGIHCDIGAYEASVSAADTIRIQALIDGRSQLRLRGNTAQWHHFDFAAPGRHEFANRPTIINDVEWFPIWPDVPDAENRFCDCDSNTFTAVTLPLPLQANSIGLKIVRGREQAAIVQFPLAENDYTLIIEFNDNESLGADLYAVEITWGAPSLLVSSTSGGKVAGITFHDEDILAYNPTSASWSLFFDGSDVDVRNDVDAFTLVDGSLLLSFNTGTNVPGVGKVDDSDIVKFIPTTLGDTTAGRFELYLDGSAFGLDENDEDIDAITFDGQGRLLISTIGDFEAGGAQGKDEDLFAQEGSGWVQFFDGSDVELTKGNEDIKGAWFDAAAQELYLATKGSYKVAGLQGDKDDIFICQPGAFGAESACTFRLFWNGDDHGFGGEAIDGLFVGALPGVFAAVDVSPASVDLSDMIEEEDVDDEPEEVGDEEATYRHFLPLIER